MGGGRSRDEILEEEEKATEKEEGEEAPAAKGGHLVLTKLEGK